jgi:serine/threonine-protein kinase
MPLNPPMRLPARIGKYELREYLGGGMAHVYKAKDTVLERTVALKILTEAGNNDRNLRDRFVEEARTASSIGHDNLIRVYDFGEEQGRPYMVMEFLRGESLRDAIKGGRTGDLYYKLSIAIQIARALEYIHNRKIIHRDIKPENIHVDVTGRIRLMDFGIAKRQGVSLTQAGFTLGTPYYMAPEQVLGQQVTNLVDVYAFGIMLTELITGQKPITGQTVEGIFRQILHEPLNLDGVRQAGAPPALVDFVSRCTSKNPASRPQGFAIVRAELERILNTLGMAPAYVPQQQPSSNKGLFGKLPAKFRTQTWIITFSAAAVAVLVLILYFIGRLVFQHA